MSGDEDRLAQSMIRDIIAEIGKIVSEIMEEDDVDNGRGQDGDSKCA